MYVYECMHVGWHFPRPTAAQLEGREKCKKRLSCRTKLQGRVVKNGAKFPFQNKLPRDREREIELTFRQTRLDPFSRLARTRDLGCRVRRARV